jgi:hypothetical protein
MSSYVDFAALKEAISIEQVAQMLDLQLKQNNGQFRGPCPTCGTGGDRALVITPAKGLFYCFADKKGGDQISLAAHIREEALKDAAQFITGSSTVPEEKVAKETKKLQPLTLEHDHELVTAIGFDPEVAEALGIGYCKKGVMKGTVAIPLRDEDGQLLHYVGVDSPVTLPKALHYAENVVAFPKRSA